MFDFKKIPWQVYLRIVLGIGGLGGGLYGLIDPAGQVEKMKLFAETTPFGWYAELLNNFFLPNATLAVNLINLITLLFGIFFISGLFINLGCIVGIIISIYWVAGQISNPLHTVGVMILIVLALAVVFSKKSRKYSLDEKIFRKS